MAKQKEIAQLTYEEAFAELEQTVAELEGELADLEAAMGLFERGQALAAHCQQLLEAAELKVQELSEDGQLKDFE